MRQGLTAGRLRTALEHAAQVAWPWLARGGPWALLASFIAWGWGQSLLELGRVVPAYVDVLEQTWTITWFREALRQGRDPLVYPLAFFPQGWHVATWGSGLGTIIPLLPLQALGGTGFAYQAAALLTFILAFAGMRQLALRFVSAWPAGMAGLLYAFAGARWFAMRGHVTTLLGTALLPWMAWSLEGAFEARRRAWLWLVAAGALWALAIWGGYYYVWIGGLLLLAWVAGRRAGRGASWRMTGLALGVPIGVAAALAAPTAYWFLRVSHIAKLPPFSLLVGSYWSASLNNLTVPYIFHPWLGALTRAIYHGSLKEQAAKNLGLLACLAALAGLKPAWRHRARLSVVLVIAAGIIMALGPVLKWDDQSLHWEAMRPVNAAIWQVGHWLKPAIFGSEPPKALSNAIPLPALLLATAAPYLEQGRVFARYAALASLGIAILAALALARLRRRWMQAIFTGLLLFEVLPLPLARLPFPPPIHPAFDWLKEHPAPGEAIADVAAWDMTRLTLYSGGAPTWATLLHGQPMISGPGGAWPAHTQAMIHWLDEHPRPFHDPTFVATLRSYRVHYLVFHMLGSGEAAILADAADNAGVRVVGRFEPPAGSSPWPYPITVVEILPPAQPDMNLLFDAGWSGSEAWGRWMEGTQARATWFATARADERLSITAFPNCLAGQRQRIVLVVNGVKLATHDWDDCETWTAELTVPAGSVRIGENVLAVRAGYAVQPADVAGAGDTRQLSVGFSRLRVQRQP